MVLYNQKRGEKWSHAMGKRQANSKLNKIENFNAHKIITTIKLQMALRITRGNQWWSKSKTTPCVLRNMWLKYVGMIVSTAQYVPTHTAASRTQQSCANSTVWATNELCFVAISGLSYSLFVFFHRFHSETCRNKISLFHSAQCVHIDAMPRLHMSRNDHRRLVRKGFVFIVWDGADIRLVASSICCSVREIYFWVFFGSDARNYCRYNLFAKMWSSLPCKPGHLRQFARK